MTSLQVGHTDTVIQAAPTTLYGNDDENVASDVNESMRIEQKQGLYCCCLGYCRCPRVCRRRRSRTEAKQTRSDIQRRILDKSANKPKLKQRYKHDFLSKEGFDELKIENSNENETKTKNEIVNEAGTTDSTDATDATDSEYKTQITKFDKEMNKVRESFEKDKQWDGNVTYQDMKGRKRILFFDGKLRRLSDIDTAKQTFQLRMHYFLTYLATKKEVIEYFQSRINGDSEYKPKFLPKLSVENLVEGSIDMSGISMKHGCSGLFQNITKIKYKYWYSLNIKKAKDEKGKEFEYDTVGWDIHPEILGFDPRFAFFWRVKYECDIKAFEEFELESFPFDSQDLAVNMKGPKKANVCDILPIPRCGDYFDMLDRYWMCSDWKIAGVLIEFGYSDTTLSKIGFAYPLVWIRVKAERKWTSQLSNIMVTFAMFMLGFATFAIPIEAVGERLAYAITLLLADVATLQFVNDTTPTIAYDTKLEKYMYWCFGWLVVMTIWSAGCGWDAQNGTLVRDLDRFVATICGFFVFLFHLKWIYDVRQIWVKEGVKLELYTYELKELFEKERNK